MKIYFCNVLDYEKPILEALIKEFPEDQISFSDKLFDISDLDKLEGYDGICVHGNSLVDGAALEKMKEMGILHLSTRTIGFDHIDAAKAKELGIHLYNAFYSPHNVADFTVMMMLIMLRKAKISICRALVNDFSLDGMMGREIHSLTIGIIGTGKIGETVIRNLSGFGCKILANDKYEKESLKGLCQYVPLDQLYKEADIISLHMPLTDENYHMINRQSIAKMKKGVILINTARGQLIDTEALIEGIESQQVGGAGIDTLEEEKGTMHVHVGTKIVDNRNLYYLKQFPNVLYTQHYAFFTQEASESMVRCGIESIRAGLHGQSTPCEVKL